MPVTSRIAGIALAVAVWAAVPVMPAQAHDDHAILRLQKAVQDVFSGKIFKEAYKKAKEAQRRHALKRAGYSNQKLPFYVPDKKTKPTPRLKPVAKPKRQKRKAVAKIHKPKAVLASPKVKSAQVALNTLGFEAGKPDGVFGRKTAMAIERYQDMLGRPATGKLTPDERKMLFAAAKKKRQMAAVQPSQPAKGAQSYTVIKKRPSEVHISQSGLILGAPKVAPVSTLKKRPAINSEPEDAKAVLPGSSAAEAFDADDPEDELVPAN